MQVLTIEQLSEVIHKSVTSIRSDRLRNPKSLPPSFTLPGSRRVLFKDVDQWIESLVSAQLKASAQPEQQEIKTNKRGRPTIAQLMQRDIDASASCKQ
jgi:hypothetical protein